MATRCIIKTLKSGNFKAGISLAMQNKLFLVHFMGFLLLGVPLLSQELQIVKSREGVLVLEGPDSVLFFQSATKSQEGQYARADYIHPLWGLDGGVLTEDFPQDHLHHRGIFWAWHQVYVGDTRAGDAWECRDFIWDVKSIDLVASDEGSITMVAQTEWLSPLIKNKKGKPAPFVREFATVKIHRSQKYFRIVDFSIQLLPLMENISLGGSEDDKGYGGFSVRVKTPEPLVFESENGLVEPQTLPLDEGSWVDVSGPIGKFGHKAGITIIGHEDNPGHPQGWLLRSRNSMQNPAFPGREPVLLLDDQPLTLKYRLVIHSGTLNKIQIAGFCNDYNKSD